MISFRHLLVYGHVLLVRAVVDAVPLVDEDLRDVLPGLCLKVVGSRSVLAQRRRLYKFWVLVLYLQRLRK